MNVSFEVLGVQTAASYRHHTEQPRRELQCLLTVSHSVLQSRPFDAARLNVFGLLKSNINGIKSNKPFITLTKSVHWSDFYPMTPCPATSKSRQQADVSFNLGPADASCRTNFLPFSSVSIASETTCDHALSNRRHIKAQSRVQYTYEVVFYNKMHEVQVVRGPVSIDQCSAVQLSPVCQSQQLSHRLKTPQRSMGRLKSLGQNSEDPWALRFTLDEKLGETMYDKPPTVDSSTISIPFSLDLTGSGDLPTRSSQLVRSGATCIITAKWYIHRTVGTPGHTSSRTNINGVSKSSVITVKTEAAIPPLYPAEATNSERQYSAASSIELELPRSALVPTVDIDGLRINYELDLQVAITGAGLASSTEKRDPGAAKSLGETNFRMPISVLAA